MACVRKADLLSQAERELIKKYLMFTPKTEPYRKKFYAPPAERILASRVTDGVISLPFAFARRVMGWNTENDDVGRMMGGFTGELREYQLEDRDLAISQLKQHRSTTLCLYTGFGKTVLGIYLACRMGLKTLVLYSGGILGDQWMDTILNNTDCPYFIVPTGDKYSVERLDVDIVVCMETRFKSLPSRVKSSFGMVIVDEMHTFCSPTRVRTLLDPHLTPKYLMGMTATPDKEDGMTDIIIAFCGVHRVVRKSTKPFSVYVFETGEKFELVKDNRWASLITSQVESDRRNDLAVYLAVSSAELGHKVLMLSWRKEHVDLLYDWMESDDGPSVAKMRGSDKTYDDSDILVATYSKLGVGFDEKTLCKNYSGVQRDVLIMLGSIKSTTLFTQVFGRVRGRADYPVLFYLLDNDSISKKHWSKVKKWCTESNGIIEYA